MRSSFASCGLAALAWASSACFSSDAAPITADARDAGDGTMIPGPSVDPSNPMNDKMAAPDPGSDAGTGTGDSDAGTGSEGSGDGGLGDASGASNCKKHITVLLSVGVPGTSKWKGNGCWTVLNADGGGNPDWRKCSTNQHVVKNPSAINYAYDDTNPTAPLSSDVSFLNACSQGATGDGWEYMAYRGGWRLLGNAPHLRGFFAELYGTSNSDIDSLWFTSGVYRNNALLAKHTVYPMINYGPPMGSGLEKKIQNDAKVICDTVKDGGYFGTYNASYRESWSATDSRLVALERALDACTGK